MLIRHNPGLILAFHLLKEDVDFETAISETISFGGDLAKNAAIVGGLIGAKTGVKAIP